jgi:hypothetical protein
MISLSNYKICIYINFGHYFVLIFVLADSLIKINQIKRGLDVKNNLFHLFFPKKKLNLPI